MLLYSLQTQNRSPFPAEMMKNWKFVTAGIIILATTRYNYYKLPVCIYNIYACYDVYMYTIQYTLYQLSHNEDNSVLVAMLGILY